MPNPAPAMPTAGPIETAQSLCNRLFPHYEPDRIAASTAVSVRDAQWSARLAAIEARHSTVVDGLRRELAEAEATRDACLSMATIDKETTMEKQSLRAKLAGEISVNGEPMSAPPPKPDLSKWPEWEAVEWRPARRGELVYGGGNEIWPWGLSTPSNHPLWILRRRTPAPEAPPPNAADEAEVGRLAKVASDAFRFYAGDGPKVWWYVARSVRDAVLAAQRPKAVDVEEAAKIAYEAPHPVDGVVLKWSDLADDMKEVARSEVRLVIRLCGCTVAEKGEEPVDIEKLRRFAQYAKKESALDDELCEMAVRAAAEIERLRGEGE